MLSAVASHRSTEPSEAVFVTGWAGALTFAEIREQLTPNLYRLLRYYRRPEAELDDQHAHCFMRLWMELRTDPAFLANASKNEALRLLLNRTNPQSYRKHEQHEVSLEDPSRIRHHIYDTPSLLGWATQHMLDKLNSRIRNTRDNNIRVQHSNGERLSDLAHEYGLSPSRIWQIVNSKHH